MKTYIRKVDDVSMALVEGRDTIAKFTNNEYTLVTCTSVPSDWDEGKYTYKEGKWAFVGRMYFIMKQLHNPGFVITKPEVI